MTAPLTLALVALISVAGSFVQASTGFGYAVTVMALWPLFLPYRTALVVEVLASMALCVTIAVRYRRHINWKQLVAPCAASFVTNWLGIQIMAGSPETVLRRLLGAALMALAVNPPLGRFNQKLYRALDSMRGGSRLTVGAVLGALMATDYGGPINKAAYLTGTLALVSGQLDIMAAVMIGGMVPPIGVALACLLFPHRFTREERRTAPQNLLMGASFVTEGALPFALRDPLRVVPACMAGSSLAGALAVQFGCRCPAPHGGLFLIAVIDNPIGFLVALLCGSLLTALIMGVLKKPVKG